MAADLNGVAAERTARAITTVGGEALAVEVDVRRRADVRRMIDATVT